MLLSCLLSSLDKDAEVSEGTYPTPHLLVQEKNLPDCLLISQ